MSGHEHHHDHDDCHEHEHHHDHCGCHEHEHHHEHCGCHEHEHHHDHCGCHEHEHHHSRGEALIEQALVISREGTLLQNTPLSFDAAIEKTRSALLSIAHVISIEGIVPGHIKAFLSNQDASCTLSVTREEVCDMILPEDTSGVSSSYHLTVNIISAIRPSLDVNSILDPLFS